MNKILNWTCSGFFRSLGRFLLYLCVSILIYGFLYKIGFKLPFMYVNASVDYNDYTANLQMWMQNWGSSQSSKNHLYTSNTLKTSSYFENYIYYSCPTSDCSSPYPFLVKDKYYSITYVLGNGTERIYPNWEELINDNNIPSSSIFNSSPFSYIYVFLPDNDTSSSDYFTHNVDDYLNYLNVSDIVVDSSMTYNRYYITYVFSPKIDMRRLRFRANFIDSSISSSKSYYYNIVDFSEVNENNIPTLFDNINDVINDLIDAIDDTADMLGEHLENGTLLDLFPQFEIKSEKILTSVATLPLESLNAILENNYDDLCGVIKGTTFCLPNGDLIWSRSNTTTLYGNANYVNFISFIRLFLGGGLIYLCCVSLFKTIHRCMDPMDSNIEVMKL